MDLRIFNRKTSFPFQIMIFFLFILLGWYGRSLSDEGLLKEVKVKGLFLDPQPVVLLTDLQGKRVLPIWIGIYEAIAINAEIKGETHQRPLTHDLLASVIKHMEGTIERVIVSDLKEGIYYARLFIQTEQANYVLDARPSDAIVLALKWKSPIFVEGNLFQKVSHKLGKEPSIKEKYGLKTQDLTPAMAESFAFQGKGGILIADVRKRSRAAEDGLKPGDIIVSINDLAVKDQEGFWSSFSHAKGQSHLKVFRRKRFMEVILHPSR